MIAGAAMTKVTFPHNLRDVPIQFRIVQVEDCPETRMPNVALVVDDSMLIRHTVCRFLEAHGFTVESATNGQDALEVLKRIRPDVVITDMQMPKMSGAELITALKAEPATVDIPIVILAGKQSGFEKKEKRANFAVFKDIDIEDQLGKALAAVLGEKASAKATGK